MRIQTFLTTIGLFALGANSQQLTLKHNVDINALNFEANHVSVAQDNNINYEVGRAMVWEGVGASNTTSGAKTANNSGINNNQSSKNTETWVYNLQGKAIAYQAERNMRLKRYENKLSGYSPTEIRIAQSMGKEPWEINRNQLKKWAKETDNIIP
jgi:hypothetical protein